MAEEQTGTPEPRAPVDAAEAVATGTQLLMPPTRLIRVAGVVHRVLEEIRAAPLDDAGRVRAVELLRSCVAELRRCLEPSAREELLRLLIDMDSAGTSDATLRVAQATVVGWVDGLLEGFQAAWSARLMTTMRPTNGGSMSKAGGQRTFGDAHDAIAGRYL